MTTTTTTISQTKKVCGCRKPNHKSCNGGVNSSSSVFFSLLFSIMFTSTLKFYGQNKCQLWRYKFVIINSAQLTFSWNGMFSALHFAIALANCCQNWRIIFSPPELFAYKKITQIEIIAAGNNNGNMKEKKKLNKRKFHGNSHSTNGFTIR